MIEEKKTVLELASDKFIYYTINNGLNNEAYISFEDIPSSSKEFWRDKWNEKSPLEMMKFSREEFPRMEQVTEKLKQVTERLKQKNKKS